MKKLLLFIGAVTIMSCSSDPIEYNNAVVNPKIYAERVPGISASLPDAWELELSDNVLNKIKINSSQEDTFNYTGGKLSEVNHFSNSIFTGSDEFIYDTNGRVLSITGRNADNVVTSTRLFNYSDPDLIEEVNSTYNASGVITSGYTVFKKIENGNLVKYNFSEYQLDTYYYDSNENIFSNLNSLNELVLYYSNDKIGKNNRVTSVSNFYFNGTLNITRTYQYINQYDSNKIIKRSVLNSGTEEYRELFTYN